jgi:hypothetical protein
MLVALPASLYFRFFLCPELLAETFFAVAPKKAMMKDNFFFDISII